MHKLALSKFHIELEYTSYITN